MVILNWVWLSVTLLTDYDSAFYRKAIVYKNKVDKAMQKKRQEEQTRAEDADSNVNISLNRSRTNSMFGTIENTSTRPLIDEKVRSNSFNQFMMYEKL